MKMDATREAGRSHPRSLSSQEACISPGSETSVSELSRGMFFDRHAWQCEACFMVLVDWQCPYGHNLRP